MRSFLLLVFGSIGFAITCLQGIVPFIQASQLLSWVVENWIDWTRSFWHVVFAYFDFTISKVFADLLTALVFTFSFGIGFKIRRHNIYYFYLNFQEKWHIKNASSLIDLLSIIAIKGMPIGIVITILGLNSITIGLIFSILFLVFLSGHALFPSKYVDPIENAIFGEIPESVSHVYNAGTASAYCAILMSYTVIFSLIIIIAMNEIGVHANNILEMWRWIRCQAQIDCL